jgi:addiction module RelE/StbE family toxin
VKLVWSTRFTRAVRKLTRRKPNALDLLEAAFRRLEIDPFDPKLRSHPLSGEFKGSWACSADYDLRVIFEFQNDPKTGAKEIHLLNVGSHDEVY